LISISEFRILAPVFFWSLTSLKQLNCRLPNLQQEKQTGETMKKIRKIRRIRRGTQLKLTNQKNAGRPAIRDKGIRHTRREEIIAPRPLHLTIKLIVSLR
jgi:hypothetical protein